MTYGLSKGVLYGKRNIEEEIKINFYNCNLETKISQAIIK
jgi:hypothetical protein